MKKHTEISAARGLGTTCGAIAQISRENFARGLLILFHEDTPQRLRICRAALTAFDGARALFLAEPRRG